MIYCRIDRVIMSQCVKGISHNIVSEPQIVNDDNVMFTYVKS